jgi:hypothetical protein
MWYLTNERSGQPGSTGGILNFGLPGDLPVAGDWDGDGRDSVGVFRPSNAMWYLTNERSGQPGVTGGILNFGLPGDLPVAGDWNGDRRDSPGVKR